MTVSWNITFWYRQQHLFWSIMVFSIDSYRTHIELILLYLMLSQSSNKVPTFSFQHVSHISFFSIVCFASIAVLPHSPGVVYYRLLLRGETRIPRVAPFSFGIGIWHLFVHRGQKSYTTTAFDKLWTTPGVRCIIHASS